MKPERLGAFSSAKRVSLNLPLWRIWTIALFMRVRRQVRRQTAVARLWRNWRAGIGRCDDGYLERMYEALKRGLVTEGEWKRADRLHRELVVQFLRKEEGQSLSAPRRRRSAVGMSGPRALPRSPLPATGPTRCPRRARPSTSLGRVAAWSRPRSATTCENTAPYAPLPQRCR